MPNTNVQNIIDEIKGNLKVYKFDLELKSFIVDKSGALNDMLVFEELKKITMSLEKNKILYIFDKNDASICVNYKNV